MGQAEGQKDFAHNIKVQVKKICKRFGGMSLTSYPIKKWQHSRFLDPYMRDALNDFGILIDTLEASVTWENFTELYQGVRKYIKDHPRTICLTHASHFYPQGTNLYFIFIKKMDHLDDFLTFQRGIIQKIIEHKGSLSHHHGIGRMMGPWMKTHLGKEEMEILQALKNHFDPDHIMNAEGVLGLD